MSLYQRAPLPEPEVSTRRQLGALQAGPQFIGSAGNLAGNCVAQHSFRLPSDNASKRIESSS